MSQELSMDNLFAILVLAGVTLFLWLLIRRPSGIPPGPSFTLPIVGNVFQIGDNPIKTFRNMRKKYGDVFGVYIANRLVVVINGFHNLKEAFVKNGDIFSERPHLYFTNTITKGKGVLGSSGEVWKEQRKFALFTLRKLGMGKNILELKIQEEITSFIEEMARQNGEATDFRHTIGTSVCNIISSIVFGKRFEYDDPKFVKFLKIVDENVAMPPALNFFPFLRFLPGDVFKIKLMMRGIETIQRELFKSSIEQHVASYDEDDTDDFISAYIKEMKQKESLGDGNSSSINKENLRAVIQDLFIAGMETTSTTIRWLLLYLLHFSDVQEKCFAEIQDNVGCDKTICVEDKTKLPYLEATIMETLRYANVVPLALMHGVSKETTFKGYRIPKDALIVPNIDSVLSDTAIWGDPENFRPDRFLDENGRLTKPEEFIPFLLGPRNCLGESLARMELFLFVASMLQKFEFVKGEGNVLPTLQCVLGFTRAPQHFVVRAVLRI
ncbi:cytochrome P450 2U1-like [Gigantopelta aegis]|uniref:cytochrome P450 2U1-like n=1 Tax=Gigantopelta aegis TaxID=1735272 RepID=UPI001B88739C|nr:cytochrome P450 2U1-like [Gigantopelta aegis]